MYWQYEKSSICHFRQLLKTNISFAKEIQVFLLLGWSTEKPSRLLEELLTGLVNMAVNMFVVIPTDSRYGIVFGKNSNRPAGEVQELIYEKSKNGEEGDIKCTHVTVPGVTKTEAVILSKPAEMWGCEMGANESGVVGGTVSLKEVSDTGLLAQDLLRLALERSSTAEAAIDIIGDLLQNFGTEGSHNGFLLVDKDGAWYLEAVGRAWVAQRVPSGVKLFSSSQHIGDNYEKAASDLEDLAKATGNWNGEGKVSWSEVFLSARDDEEKKLDVENSLLSTYFSDVTDFGVKQMTRVLRDTQNRVSRSASDVFPTAASQISVLPKSGASCHWFTATPDPTLSVFKPFIFTPNARISAFTTSSSEGEREHYLYRLHAKATASGENKVISLLQEMEANCLNEVDTFMFDGIPGQTLSEVDDLLKDCVEAEIKFYK